MLSQCLNAFTMSLIACAEPHTAPTVPKIIKKISFPAQNLHKQNAMYALSQMHAQVFCRAWFLNQQQPAGEPKMQMRRKRSRATVKEALTS